MGGGAWDPHPATPRTSACDERGTRRNGSEPDGDAEYDEPCANVEDQLRVERTETAPQQPGGPAPTKTGPQCSRADRVRDARDMPSDAARQPARGSAAFYLRADELLRPLVPLGFQSCGYLFVAHSPETLERLVDNIAVQNAEGVPSRLVTPQEAAALVPGLRTETLAGGAWC